MLALCLALRTKYSIAAVTNDIFTREDAEFLTKHSALPPARIQYVLSSPRRSQSKVYNAARRLSRLAD